MSIGKDTLRRNRNARHFYVLLVVSYALVTLSALALPASVQADERLPVPEALKPGVEFWEKIFGEYDQDYVVYFDAYDWTKIYEYHRVPPLSKNASAMQEREEIRYNYRDEIAAELEALAQEDVDYFNLTGRPLRLFGIWNNSTDPEVYRRAAENIRTQKGNRETFHYGVARAARYKEDFARIFEEEGVPATITYLPHIESSFRWNARSSVGAVGMWQFMSGTGKKYLRIDEAVDERLNPYKAARASARFFRYLYDNLGSWPLAITAYNQGLQSMLDAQSQLGSSDIDRVVAEYRGPRYKFAGRNFYVELLAARNVSERLLSSDDPGIEFDEPQPALDFTLPAYVKIQDLAKAFGVSRDQLYMHNLDFREPTRRGKEWIPKGLTIRVPMSIESDPGRLFASIPDEKQPLVKPQRSYKVRSGDSLGSIAGRFKTTVRTLQRMNGIKNPNHLRAGQVLKLP